MKTFIMAVMAVAMVLSMEFPAMGDTYKPVKPTGEKIVLTGILIKNGDSYVLVTEDCGSVVLPDPAKFKSFLTLDDYEKAVDKTVTMELRVIIGGSSMKNGKVIRKIREILHIRSMTVGNAPAKL